MAEQTSLFTSPKQPYPDQQTRPGQPKSKSDHTNSFKQAEQILPVNHQNQARQTTAEPSALKPAQAQSPALQPTPTTPGWSQNNLRRPSQAENQQDQPLKPPQKEETSPSARLFSQRKKAGLMPTLGLEPVFTIEGVD